MKSETTVRREIKRLRGMLKRTNPEISADDKARANSYLLALLWVRPGRDTWRRPPHSALGASARKGER